MIPNWVYGDPDYVDACRRWRGWVNLENKINMHTCSDLDENWTQ